MLGHLSPVVHPKNWDLIRVPMLRTDEHHVVFVGDKTTRIFTEDTLPDVLKTKMAMILASDGKYKHDHDIYKLDVYVNKQSPELDEVGWRVSDSYFCLILSRENLDSLTHGELNGTS
jgi:hypothetical protein